MKITPRKKPLPKNRQAAFSIIEATVGMGVMGTIIVALCSGFTTGFFTMKLARENLRATQILLEKMETIRLYTWDQINDPGFIPRTFVAPYDPNAQEGEEGVYYQGSMTITNVSIGSTYASHMREVKVSLTWQTGGLIRNREFSSYISRNGLQTYIY